MALPSSTTTTGSYQYYLNSMMPDHYSNQVMMQDAYAARLRASMNCSFSQALLNGPNPAGAAWQPNWPTNPICSNPASSEAYSGRQQLSNSGTAGSAFSPPGSSLEKFGEITASYYHQLRASLNARQALKQDSARSAHGQCSAPSYPQFADGTQNLASMDRVLQRKPNEHIKPDSVDLIRELSNRLACDSNGSSLGPSLASNLARCLQLGMQQNGPLPGAWANSNSVLNTGDVPVEQSCPGTGTSYDCVAHYLFDPGFAERAAKFSSLSSMINSPPTEDNDMPSFRHSLGEINPLKFHRSSNSPSQGLASPLADSIPRRTVSFAMGSADAKSSAKQELSEDSFQTGDQANGDAHKASASAASQRRERLQQGEQARGLEESSSGTFTVDSSGHNATKNSSQSKKRRIENEDNISSGAGRDPKIADSTLDCAANKGRSPSTIEKGLQEDRQAEEEKGTGKNSGKASQKLAKDKTHFNEPPKQDFIHVRARRGQATDSHSLAERVRREKISERMRFLQDLVPGCNKITGKAMMLDEIINYVQSLQHQVEFLSMKLAALNPQLDFNIENFFAGEVLSGMMFPNEVSEAVTGTTVTSGDLPYQMLHSSLTLRDAGSVDIPSSSHGIPTDATMDGSTSYCSALRSVAATNAFSQAANAAWDVDLQSLERRDIEYEGRRLFTPNTDQIDRLMEIESVKVEL